MFGIWEKGDDKLIMSFDMEETELTIIHKRIYDVGGPKITCYICKDKEGQLYIAENIYSEFSNYSLIKGYKVINTKND